MVANLVVDLVVDLVGRSDGYLAEPLADYSVALRVAPTADWWG